MMRWVHLMIVAALALLPAPVVAIPGAIGPQLRPPVGGGGGTPGSWVTAGAAYLIDNGPALDLNGDYTIAGWFKPHADNIDGGQHCHFFLAALDGNFEKLTNLNGDGVLFSLPSASQDSAAAGYAADTWIYLAMRRSGDTLEFIADGTEVFQIAASDATRTGIDLIRIGTADSQSFRGKIAHVRAWQAVITDGQLATESASATAVITSGLSFDLTTLEADGPGHDDSGNANHFTETGGTFTFDADTPL